MKRPVLQLSAALTALLALANGANATKLDLSSALELKASNYTHLINGTQRDSQAFYSENAALGFVIKDIHLEKTPESSMDVGIILESVAPGVSSRTVTAPQFTSIAARLPNSDGSPFIRDAYVKIYKFLNPNITATFGRQDFTLGQGLTLSSDDLGFPGGLLEANNVYQGIKTDLFFFRPLNAAGYNKIVGGSAYYPGNEGLWQVYHFWQQDDNADNQDILLDTRSRTKKFTGVRYVLTQKQLSFDGEAAIQRGTAKLTDGKTGSYAGHAFMLKGSWAEEVAFFGRSKIRLGYGRSSGNLKGNVTTDKAFFPDFGKKYDGLERDGYGAIAGASLYDMLKTSATANGLPDGASGLNIINIGADLPYKAMLLSADLYKFRASQNFGGGSLQIASEWDLKLSYPLGDNLHFTAVYASFSPLGLYSLATQKIQTKLIYLLVSAHF